MPVKQQARAKAAWANAAIKSPGEPAECPLCVEPLDETDLTFKPCPCGYKVCLFCYNQLKEKCNGLCPNCRREYGSADPGDYVPDAGPGLRDADVPRQATAAQSHAVPAAGGRTGGGADAAQANAATRAHQAAAAAAARPVPVAPAPAAGAKRHEQAVAGGRGPGRPSDDAPALPVGANWAAPARQVEPPAPPPQAPPAPAIADTSAWPDLQAAVQAPPPPPQPARAPPKDRVQHATQDIPTQQGHGQPQQQPQHAKQQHNRTPSLSGAPSQSQQQPQQNASQPHRQQDTSLFSPMFQDPIVPPEQLGYVNGKHPMLGLAYQSVQVSTTAFGQCRTVGVNLAHGLVEPMPEAVGMKARLEQAILSGTMTAADASAQLVALLGIGAQRDPESAAARRPPPGFAAPAAQPAQPAEGSGGGGQLLTSADSPVPALGRLQPIGTPIGPRSSGGGGGTQAQPPMEHHPPGNGRYVANGVQKAAPPGTYNLWGGEGLQGLNLANGYGPAGYPSWLDNSPAQHAGALNHGGYGGYFPHPSNPHAMNGGVPQQGQAAAKQPPPGFAGAPPGFGPQQGGAQQAQHEQNGEMVWFGGPPPQPFPNFNEGPQAARQGPPPGMAAYRPQQLGH